MMRSPIVIGLCVPALFGVGCGPSDTHSPNRTVVASLSDSSKAELLVGQLVRMSSTGNTEEESLQNSIFFSRYGCVADSCGTPRLHRLMKVEEDLLALGKAAFPAMMAAAGKQETHYVLRRGLVDLAARMPLGREEVTVLLGLMDKEPIEQIRIAFVDAVAMQRSEKNRPVLEKLMDGSSKVPRHIIQWALGMSGNADSGDLFLTHVESVLAAEELESPLAELGIAKPDPPQDFAQVILRAKVTPANKWLSEDIWRVGQLGTRRSVGILIKALSFHDEPVQHVALSSLKKLVDAAIAPRDINPIDLYTLDLGKAWSRWWVQSETRLVFDAQQKRYSLKN